jgi:hypothetical protein
MSTNKWLSLPPIDPQPLAEAKQQLHAAIQLVGNVGRSFLPHDDKDAMANLTWNDPHDAMLGREVADGIQVGIRAATLTLVVLHQQTLIDTLPLAGHTWQEAFSWLQRQLAQAGLDREALSAERPYELPAYPPFQGKAFRTKDLPAFEALHRYYHNANRRLQVIRTEEVGASDVHIWPHHVDIATLITVSEVGKGQYIGVGMSPGDGPEGYDQPYFYVNMWPSVDLKGITLPAFEQGGHWHTEGWLGGVLTHETLTGTQDDGAQLSMIDAFLTQTIRVNRRLLADQT